MFLPKTNIHVSGCLITGDVRKLLNEKIYLFKKQNLADSGLDEQVGVLCDYKLITTNNNCGGYCNYISKEIAIKGGWTRESANDQMVIFHEIGHALQAEVGLFSNRKVGLLTSELKLEWQAESIAYAFYNSVYPAKPHHRFNAYFNEAGVQFLKEWYGGWVQDDTIEFEKKSNTKVIYIYERRNFRKQSLLTSS